MSARSRHLYSDTHAHKYTRLMATPAAERSRRVGILAKPHPRARNEGQCHPYSRFVERPCTAKVMARNRERIINRVTRPLSPSGEDSKFCAADGWIDERWECVTSSTFEAVWLSLQQFSRYLSDNCIFRTLVFATLPFCP